MDQIYPTDSQRGAFSPRLFTYQENDELQVQLQAKQEQSDQEYDFFDLDRLKPKQKVLHEGNIKRNPTLDPTNMKQSQKLRIHPETLSDSYIQEKQQNYFRQRFMTQPQKRLNQLVLFFHKQRFVNKLLSNLKRARKVQVTHLQIIADKASDNQVFISDGQKKRDKEHPTLINVLLQNFSKLPKKTFFYRIKQTGYQIIGSVTKMIDHLLNVIPLVNPDSNKKLIWDSLVAILRFIYFIIIPIDLAFNTWLISQLYIMTFLMIGAIVLDLYLRVSTICFDQGSVVTDRWQIFQTQMRRTFFKDCLSVMVLLTALSDSSQLVGYLSLGYFVQYEFFQKTIEYLEDRFLLNKMTQSIWTLLKLMIGLLYIIHIFCCLWFLVSNSTQTPNWIHTKQLQNSSRSLQYLESFYFATVTVLTIGYGDNVPISSSLFKQDPQEKLVAILFMIAACIWLSYSVNVIGSIINDIKRHKDEITLKLRLINKYMHRKNIAFTLRYQIKQYLTFLWENQTEGELTRQFQIIDELAPDLKSALHLEAKSVIVQQSKFIQENFSSEFKKILISKVKTQCFYPNSTFSTQLNTNDYNYCYIDLGVVSLVPNDDYYQQNLAFPKLHEGQHIGLREFITGVQENSKYIYRCHGFVQILYLTKNDFIQSLRDFPIDEEKYHHIKGLVMFNLQENLALTYCSSCQSLEHDFRECPILISKVDRELVLKRYLYDHIQSRKAFDRQNHRRLDCLLNLNQTQGYAEIFIEENQNTVLQQLNLQLDQEEQNQSHDYLINPPKEVAIDENQVKVKILQDERNQLIVQQPSLGFITLNSSPTDQENIQIDNSREAKYVDHKRQVLKRHCSLIREKLPVSKKLYHSNGTQAQQSEFSRHIKLPTNEFHHELQRIKLFNQNQLNNIEQLHKQCNQRGYVHSDLELLVKKNSNLEVEAQDNFEVIKEFQYFSPNSNLSQTLRNLQISEVEEIKYLTKVLTKYMFYPYEYTRRYVRKQNQDPQNRQSLIASLSQRDPINYSPDNRRKLLRLNPGLSLQSSRQLMRMSSRYF